jgi:hypothetical protein
MAQTSNKLKTVWNDVKAGKTFVYSAKDVNAICESALFHAMKANTGNKDILANINAAESIKVKKAKARGLKPKKGFNNGFVTKIPITGKNMCVVASSVSCFPISLREVKGKVGDPCDGDVIGEVEG